MMTNFTYFIVTVISKSFNACNNSPTFMTAFARGLPTDTFKFLTLKHLNLIVNHANLKISQLTTDAGSYNQALS